MHTVAPTYAKDVKNSSSVISYIIVKCGGVEKKVLINNVNKNNKEPVTWGIKEPQVT